MFQKRESTNNISELSYFIKTFHITKKKKKKKKKLERKKRKKIQMVRCNFAFQSEVTRISWFHGEENIKLILPS